MKQPQRELLVVFSENDFDREFLKNSLEQFFSDYLEIIPLSSATQHTFHGTPKAVVANVVALEAARKRFPDSQIIYTLRLVSGYCLERVIDLPAGTPVLVANKPQAMAEETVRNLVDLGINHLEMQPYYPNCGIDVSRYDTVIYVGTRAYCPEGKKEYIDIGYRSFSQSALAEIIAAYNLPFEQLNVSYHKHAKLIVQGLYNTHAALMEAKRLQKNFEQVCILSTNAIINLDEDGKIIVCNPAAEQLLGVKPEDVVGKRYQDAFRAINSLRQLIVQSEDVTDRMIYIQNHAVLATMRLIELDGGRQAFLSLVPVERLLNTEEKARANMHRRGFVAKHTFEDIKGESAAICRTVTLARYYANTEATVLITGESGTGKELFAQSLHNASRRARGPFVGVNFAAIPENLIDSELFGYDEGAFTGAVKGGKPGLFRSAHRGTIFLDEIGDVSPSMQSRLLRVLEEREIMPVGSSRVIPVDVRIICATNKNLPKMVAEGKFREDLYYRLKVFTLHIPALRERKEDVPVILESMTRMELPVSLRDWLMSYSWPGNIRELKSIAQHFTLFSEIPDPETEEGRIWESVFSSFFYDSGFGTQLPEQEAQQAMQPEDLALLRCIEERSRTGQSVGRYSLARAPELAHIGMTESRIKLRLSRLKEMGYLLSGKTRQGVSLSPLGKQLIR